MTARARGLCAALVPLAASSYYLHLLTLTFVYGIMAMSLDLLVGYTGLSSLGHAAYFGVAGYTVGVLSTRFGLGFWPTAALAVLGGFPRRSSARRGS